MTKWINPGYMKRAAQSLAEDARYVIFTDAPHTAGDDPLTTIGHAQIEASAAPNSEGVWSVTFAPYKGTDRALVARRAGEIRHVTVMGHSPTDLTVAPLFATTCPPSPVVEGQELTCAPFTLVIGGGSI